MPDFGTLKPVNIRELWPNEARDFTPWLADNIDRLGDALALGLRDRLVTDPASTCGCPGSSRKHLPADAAEASR